MILGHESVPHSRPYQVHNVFILNNGDFDICGGALISSFYILTAAHCFMNLHKINKTVVMLGAHNLEGTDKKYQVTDNYILHKQFKVLPTGKTENDIALIKLPEPVTFNINIQPIILPRRSQVNETFEGSEVTIAGWGQTESQKSSHILMEETGEVVTDMNNCPALSSLLCVLGKNGGSPCVGDSGSPLVTNDNIIIGILSSGYCFLLSYYTRVTNFLDWIEQNSDVVLVD